MQSLSFWCPKYGVSFGRAYPNEDGVVPKGLIKEIGPLIETEHAISGTVFIQDNATLLIRDFNYDGTVRLDVGAKVF